MKRRAQVALRVALLAVAPAGATLLCAQDGGHGAPAPLADIVSEARNNNTQVAAAEHAWRAAMAQLAVQDASPSGAGSAPQSDAERVRLDVARKEADTQQAQIAIVRTGIVDRVKAIYFRLAYLYQMYELDDRGADDLAALIQTEMSRYSQGMGSQSEVLEAQLERTKLLLATTKHHEEVGGLQAELKGLLHRAPDSPDVIPEPVSATKLKQSASGLLASAEEHNPAVLADRAVISAQSARLEAVKSGVELDSTPGFLLRHADESDNAVLVFDRQPAGRAHANAEAPQAAERLESSRAQASEDRLRQLAEVEKQYTFATSSDELMRECKEGLIPQSKAVYDSKLAGYQSGRERFGAVIQAFLDQLTFEDQYLQAILEHETSLAHLESLTGETLR